MVAERRQNVGMPAPGELIKVAVAVVTYGNRTEHLSRMLEGIFQQTTSEAIHCVVICDNGASKESKTLLADVAAQRSKVHIVPLPENTGSARGFSEAIQAAAASGCTHIWCLDDDNRPYSDALERLLGSLESVEPGAALLSLRDAFPRYVRRAQGAPVEEVFERPYSFLGFSVLDLPKKVRRRFLAYSYDTSQTVSETNPVWIPYAPYGGFLFKAEQLLEVGLPKDAFYLYEDDHEFTARFAARGHPIYLIPSSRIEDMEQSWYLSLPDRSRWGSQRLLIDGEESMLMRRFYATRNRAFFEYHSLGWGRNALYSLNVSVYLLLLFIQTLLLRIHGQRLSWISFTTILRAALDGWRGRLGRVSEAAR